MGTNDRRHIHHEVVKATKRDLTALLPLLEQEHVRNGGGFWCNRDLIQQSQGESLWVIRLHGEAVAFAVGHYGDGIMWVREDCRRKGCGSALVAAMLERAHRNNVNVLNIECAPPSSWEFWQRQGFQRYGDLSDSGRITARHILERSFELDKETPLVNVVVGCYPEAVMYADSEIQPVLEHSVRGVRLDSGIVALERRVILLCDLEPEQKDLVIRIEIDGVVRCFCKAKHREASEAGLQFDHWGNNFYLDAVKPVWTDLR